MKKTLKDFFNKMSLGVDRLENSIISKLDELNIKAFLSGDSKLPRTKMNFLDVIVQDDAWWENNHDFIQWVFPSWETSNFNKDAPILSKNKKINLDEDSLLNIIAAYKRFLKFLKSKEFVNQGLDHNYLRITRAIKFEQYLSYHKIIEVDFKNQIDEIFNGVVLPFETREFWNKNYFN